jgi:membrane-associated phospholipid phosphatase
MMFATAGALTVIAAPFDRPIQRELLAWDMQGNRFLRRAESGLAFAGGPGPFIAGGALLAGGYMFGLPTMSDVGLHLTEGVVLAATITAMAKGITGRALPDFPTEDAGEFRIGRGFHRRNGPFVSFPSGHTAAGFAMAAVLTREAEYRNPGTARVVGPIAYTGATLIAMARLYGNVHWASDLPLGAAIGIWSGTTIVSQAHRHSGPRGRVAGWLRGTTVAPSAFGGYMIGWSANVGAGNW